MASTLLNHFSATLFPKS